MTMQSDDAYEIQMRKTDAAEAEIARLQAAKRRALVRDGERAKENVALRAVLKRLYLLALTSNEIRPDAKVMREVGQMVATLEQSASGEV